MKTLIAISLFFFISFQMFGQSDRQKVENFNKELTKVMLAGKYDETVKFYADDVVSMPDKNKMTKGMDGIKEGNAKMTKTQTKYEKYDIKTEMVESCGNKIIEVGSYKIKLTANDLKEPFESEGKYITIYEKQADGSLKIKYETWNTDKSEKDTNK